MSPTWETAADWDAAQSETGVHHEQPTGTDWAASDKVEKGYPTSDEGGSSLSAYLPFDEDSGSTANDVSGSGNDGTISGATLQASGVLSTDAYSFDGTDDQVTISSSSDLLLNTGGSSAITVTGWINPDSASANAGIFGTVDDFSTDFHYQLELSSGNLAADINSGGSTTTSLSIPAGSWSHVGIVCVTDSSGNYSSIRAYKNGTSEQTHSNTGFSPVGSPDSTVGVVNADFNYFAGDVDEVRIYDRELSSGEMTDLYNAAAGTSTYVSSKKQL